MLNVLSSLDTLAYVSVSRLQQRHTLTAFFRLVSHTGDGLPYLLLAALIYWNEPLHYLQFSGSLLLAFLIELPCFLLLKSLIKRDRPFVRVTAATKAIEPSDKFSMPSGHTAAAFLVATVVAGFYGEFALIAFVWAGLIGTSRVFLGVHYPGDILAGAVLGTGSSIIAMGIVN